MGFAIPRVSPLGESSTVFRSRAAADEVDFFGFALSWPCALLQSLTRAGRCASLEAQPLPWGFIPLQRLRLREPTSPGFASPGTLRLQGSSALLAPFFSRSLHGPVSCRARSWGSPFEAFPFAERGYASRRALTLLPSAQAARGVHRTPRPAPGLYSLRKSVARSPRGPGERLDAPLGFTSPGVSSRVRRPAASRESPPSGLARASHPARAPRSLDHARAGSSPWRPPPLSRFLHLVPAPPGSRSGGPSSWIHPGRRWHRCSCASGSGRHPPLQKSRRIGCRCRNRFARSAPLVYSSLRAATSEFAPHLLFFCGTFHSGWIWSLHRRFADCICG
jgi:hypothetical protein